MSTSPVDGTSVATTIDADSPVRSTQNADPDVFLRSVNEYLERKPLTKEQLSWGGFRGNEIFANNETPLAHVTTYGFDYDYTLCSYNEDVQRLIYDAAKTRIVSKMGFPAHILERQFDPKFAVRGLHFDTNTGYMFKVDQFGKINPESAWHGRQLVPTADLIREYGGLTITTDYRKKFLVLMGDLFCLPEACLIADTIEVLRNYQYEFDPEYVYRDIRKAHDWVHLSGKLHNAIINRPDRYLDKNPDMGKYLLRLRKANKMVFLLTNSPFKFVDAGMKHMLASFMKANPDIEHWTQLFDITIVRAEKPSFYDRKSKFRRVNLEDGSLSWTPVTGFVRGEVYSEGGLKEFTRLTGRTGTEVLYMGDHLFADLVRPSMSAGWKTAAIIKEVTHEAQVMSSKAFKTYLRDIGHLEALIGYGQLLQDQQSTEMVDRLKQERSRVNGSLRTIFNEHFGSGFRTNTHRTTWFFDLCRYADIYTSDVANFLDYPLNYCAYPARHYYPHETRPSPSWGPACHGFLDLSPISKSPGSL